MRRVYWFSGLLGVGAVAFGLAVVIGSGSGSTSSAGQPLWANGQFVAHTQQLDLTILPVTPPRGLIDERVVEPNFAVQPGVPVTLTVRNYTTTVHTFTVPGLGVSLAILPGAKGAPRTTTYTFTPNKRGVFSWYCAHCPGHMMTGTLYAIVGSTRAVAA